MSNIATGKSEKDFEYKHYLVAFLDLLGQKEKIVRLNGALNLESDEVEMVRKIKNSAGTVIGFRKLFLNYFDAYLKENPKFNLPKHIQDKYKHLNSHAEIKFQGFSDSTITWIPIHVKEQNDYVGILNSIHGVLASIATTLPVCLSVKIPFRGGVDLEGGIEISDHEIHGPAFLQAYNLECNEAKYPRVLVGSGLSEFLQHVSSVQFMDADTKKYCELMLKECRKLIIHDDQNKQMIHFLGPSVLELLGSKEEIKLFYENHILPMGNFIEESINSFHDDEKLQARYVLLKNYYEKNIGLWRNSIQ